MSKLVFDEKEFILKGYFEGIRTGTEQEIVEANYPLPESKSTLSKNAQIWTYGQIELLFARQKTGLWALQTIFCEDFEIYDNELLLYKPWISDKNADLNHVCALLNDEKADFSVIHRQTGTDVKISKSKVVISFAEDENGALTICAIGLTDY